MVMCSTGFFSNLAAPMHIHLKILHIFRRKNQVFAFLGIGGQKNKISKCGPKTSAKSTVIWIEGCYSATIITMGKI